MEENELKRKKIETQTPPKILTKTLKVSKKYKGLQVVTIDLHERSSFSPKLPKLF